MQFTRFGGTIAALSLTLAVFGPVEASAATRSRSATVHAKFSYAYDNGAAYSVRAVRYGQAEARSSRYPSMSRYDAPSTSRYSPIVSSYTGDASRYSAAAFTPVTPSYSASAASYAGSSSSGRLQCVPFARENTGIELTGNASGWWHNAEGVYARGARPEIGSVLNFRANGRMRMGHVAVVSNLVDARTIQIDHANWTGPGVGRGNISRNVTVMDVSDRNDWTAVRVALSRGGDFGSVYPTYGFIYDRADTGVMTANNGSAPAAIVTAAARPAPFVVQERVQLASAPAIEEVAEAEDAPRSRYGSRRSVRQSTREQSPRYSRYASQSYASQSYASPRGYSSYASPHAYTTAYNSKVTIQHVSSRSPAPTHVAAAHTGHRHRL